MASCDPPGSAAGPAGRKQRDAVDSGSKPCPVTSGYDTQRGAKSAGPAKRHGTSAWRRCVRVASAQFGIITWEQLLACGLAPVTIHRLVKAGALHRLHRGVYVVGHLALAPMAREFAAQCACGPGSVVSHRSAAYLWGLLKQQPEVVDVTLVGRHCR